MEVHVGIHIALLLVYNNWQEIQKSMHPKLKDLQTDILADSMYEKIPCIPAWFEVVFVIMPGVSSISFRIQYYHSDTIEPQEEVRLVLDVVGFNNTVCVGMVGLDTAGCSNVVIRSISCLILASFTSSTCDGSYRWKKLWIKNRR